MSHNKHFLTFHFLGLNTKSITTPATYVHCDYYYYWQAEGIRAFSNSYCNAAAAAAANDLIALIRFITADTKHWHHCYCSNKYMLPNATTA